MSFSAPAIPQIAPPANPTPPAPPPVFGTLSPGQKPGAKASQATFLGSGLAANPTDTGQKTLLGT